MNYLDKIAAFFDVSEEELLHPDKSNLYDSFISPDERELLQMYRSLPDPGIKMAVKKALATFAGCVVPEQHTSEQIGLAGKIDNKKQLPEGQLPFRWMRLKVSAD
jgi:hypothetical protein